MTYEIITHGDLQKLRLQLLEDLSSPERLTCHWRDNYTKLKFRSSCVSDGSGNPAVA